MSDHDDTTAGFGPISDEEATALMAATMEAAEEERRRAHQRFDHATTALASVAAGRPPSSWAWAPPTYGRCAMPDFPPEPIATFTSPSRSRGGQP